jgi:hypothetical protein
VRNGSPQKENDDNVDSNWILPRGSRLVGPVALCVLSFSTCGEVDCLLLNRGYLHRWTPTSIDSIGWPLLLLLLLQMRLNDREEDFEGLPWPQKLDGVFVSRMVSGRRTAERGSRRKCARFAMQSYRAAAARRPQQLIVDVSRVSWSNIKLPIFSRASSQFHYHAGSYSHRRGATVVACQTSPSPAECRRIEGIREKLGGPLPQRSQSQRTGVESRADRLSSTSDYSTENDRSSYQR